MRILIAEDSVTSRLLLERTLQKWGYQVVSCKDGGEAWRELQSEDPPQLAILDWMMPGYSGPELCRMVREQGREPYTYVVLLTSRREVEDVVEGIDAGADDYLTKPFHHHELHARLRAGLRILDLQSQLLAAREELRLEATHDSLTGLWNRLAILEMLDREHFRAQRENQPLGVALMDIDHFKSVNDTYGHQAGDEVLRQTARRMMGVVRPYDGVGRYGGEEFLVILPGCDERCLNLRSEQMRTAIAAGSIEAGMFTLDVTSSFGCTVFDPGQTFSPEHLIKVADAALYEAKFLGRNRVMYREAGSMAVRQP